MWCKRFIICAFALIGLMQAQDTSEKGKTIFNQRCAACHKLEQKLIGPPLARISERRSEAWFVKFVSNSQAFIQSGDAQAVAVFKEYNQQIMPPFTDLSEADIKSIWSYLNSVAASAQSSMASANAASPSATQKTIVYPGEQNTLPPSEVASLRNVFWIITGVVVLVALLIGVVIHFASLRGSSSA